MKSWCAGCDSLSPLKEFTSSGSANTETTKVTGSLETKYRWTEYGLTFTEKWNTDNTLGTEITVEDQVMVAWEKTVSLIDICWPALCMTKSTGEFLLCSACPWTEADLRLILLTKHWVRTSCIFCKDIYQCCLVRFCTVIVLLASAVEAAGLLVQLRSILCE